MAATLYLNNSKELDILLGYLHLPPKLIEVSKKRRFGIFGIPVCKNNRFVPWCSCKDINCGPKCMKRTIDIFVLSLGQLSYYLNALRYILAAFRTFKLNPILKVFTVGPY